MARKRKADVEAATDGKRHRAAPTPAQTAAGVSPAEKVKPVGGPFADFKRPTPAECRAARDALAALHGDPGAVRNVKVAAKVTDTDEADAPPQLQRTVLDSLVRTILSQNTTDTNSARAFAGLKAAFPTWESVLAAPPGAVEESVRCGGLADIKVARIKVILETLLKERNDLSLEYVRELDDEAIKEELTRFKGVGAKTVACVLMFCLERPEFPVDVHVWRITKAMSWVPAAASRDQTYEHLNLRVPDDIKYDLHVLLVGHGKRCARCSATGHPRFPPDGPCPLVGFSKGGVPGSAGKAPRNGEAAGQLRAEAAQPDAARGNNKEAGETAETWASSFKGETPKRAAGAAKPRDSPHAKEELKPEAKVEIKHEPKQEAVSAGAYSRSAAADGVKVEHFADLYQPAADQRSAKGSAAARVSMGAAGSGPARRAGRAAIKAEPAAEPGVAAEPATGPETRVKLEPAPPALRSGVKPVAAAAAAVHTDTRHESAKHRKGDSNKPSADSALARASIKKESQ